MQKKEYPTDLKLLESLKTGCFLAFTQLYERYSHDLYLALVRLVKSETDAEEILQEIFMNFWEKKDSLNINYSVKAYLFRMAENKACDFFRRIKRDRKLYDHVKNTSIGLYVLEEIMNQDEYSLLQKAIDILPPQRKRVFCLCKLEGKSYNEVSHLLQISTSTINDHIVKATNSIREFILKTPTSLIVLLAVS